MSISHAPQELVWAAWTEETLLEKWWAPKPWRTVTQSFDFREGGHWHYSILGPAGETSWAWVSFEQIDPGNSFEASDYICDAKGNKNTNFPIMHWRTDFLDGGLFTNVLVTVTFDSVEDKEVITNLGFKEGLTMGLDNLDLLFANGYR